MNEGIWAIRPSIAKRTLAAKTVLYAIFLRHSSPFMHIVVTNDRGVSGSFYENVAQKKANKKENNTS